MRSAPRRFVVRPPRSEQGLRLQAPQLPADPGVDARLVGLPADALMETTGGGDAEAVTHRAEQDLQVDVRHARAHGAHEDSERQLIGLHAERWRHHLPEAVLIDGVAPGLEIPGPQELAFPAGAEQGPEDPPGRGALDVQRCRPGPELEGEIITPDLHEPANGGRMRGPARILGARLHETSGLGREIDAVGCLGGTPLRALEGRRGAEHERIPVRLHLPRPAERLLPGEPPGGHQERHQGVATPPHLGGGHEGGEERLVHGADVGVRPVIEPLPTDRRRVIRPAHRPGVDELHHGRRVQHGHVGRAGPDAVPHDEEVRVAPGVHEDEVRRDAERHVPAPRRQARLRAIQTHGGAPGVRQYALRRQHLVRAIALLIAVGVDEQRRLRAQEQAAHGHVGAARLVAEDPARERVAFPRGIAADEVRQRHGGRTRHRASASAPAGDRGARPPQPRGRA